MIVFLNGKFVPQEQAVVSVFDRSFLYGDGLFETMRVCKGKPFRLDQHLERFVRGAEFLKIRPPFSPDSLRGFVAELVTSNQMPEALLRLTLSRGVGLRGYSPRGAESPSVVMSLHPAPADVSAVRWKLVTSSFRLLANEPLAQFKTCNKLPQILARAEADAAGADEALLLNTEGLVVEGASSNLFWIQEQMVFTPPLVSGILPGITRAVVIAICRSQGIPVRETGITLAALQQSQGIFLSLSSIGIAEGIALNGYALNRSGLVEQLQKTYAEMLSSL